MSESDSGSGGRAVQRCACGSTMVAEGATRCAICSALHKQDKAKAKARRKAKEKKGKKRDVVALGMAEQALVFLQGLVREWDDKHKEEYRGTLGEYVGKREAALKAVIALACEELAAVTEPVKVVPTLQVTGTETLHGWGYEVRRGGEEQ